MVGSSIDIRLNGELQSTEASSVEELIHSLNLSGKKFAVELNRSIVPRSQYAETKLSPGDEIELVHFVGGG